MKDNIYEKEVMIILSITSVNPRADLERLENYPELRAAIEPQLREIESALENRYENGREFIEERRRIKVVTHDTYKMEIAEFERLYGTDWQTDLDWTVNWLDVLNGRWVNFHPTDAKIVGYN